MILLIDIGFYRQSYFFSLESIHTFNFCFDLAENEEFYPLQCTKICLEFILVDFFTSQNLEDMDLRLEEVSDHDGVHFDEHLLILVGEEFACSINWIKEHLDGALISMPSKFTFEMHLIKVEFLNNILTFQKLLVNLNHFADSLFGFESFLQERKYLINDIWNNVPVVISFVNLWDFLGSVFFFRIVELVLLDFLLLQPYLVNLLLLYFLLGGNFFLFFYGVLTIPCFMINLINWRGHRHEIGRITEWTWRRRIIVITIPHVRKILIYLLVWVHWFSINFFIR